MELVFGIAFLIVVAVFVGVGLAVGSGAEGPDPGPPVRSPLTRRLTRTALLATAAYMAVMGAEAALVAGSQQDPMTGRAEAIMFGLEAAADLALAAFVLTPAWTLRRVWVLRLVSACWLVVGPVALVLTFGAGPLVSFYLGLGPDIWAAISVVAGVVLVWLSSLGGGDIADGEPASVNTPTATDALEPAQPPLPPTHWRGIVTGLALAVLMATSSWPLAQFVGANVLGACTPHWLLPGNPDFCVTGRVDAQGMLLVSGRTTLPDGTFVSVSAAKDDQSAAAPPAVQIATVGGGKFDASFDVAGLRGHSISVVASVTMSGQPSIVSQTYGADGAALSGPAVETGADAGTRVLETTLHFDIPG